MNSDRTVIDWIAGYLPPAEKWHRQVLAVLSGKDTVQALSERMRREPRNPEVKIKLGIKYQGRYLRDIALPLFQEAAALDPQGKIMMKRDDGEEVSCREMADYQYARTFLVTWGTIEPEHLEKFVRDYPSGRLTGDAYMDLTRSNRFEDEEDVAACLRLIALRPNDPAVLERYVTQIQDSQDQGEAKKTLDRGFDLAANSVRFLEDNDLTRAASNLARLWFFKGDPSKAEEAFGREFRAFQVGRWAASLMNYAEFWALKNRNLEDAEKAAVLALSICPEEAPLRRAAARIYLYPPAKPEKALEVYGPAFVKNIETNAAELYEYFSFWLARKTNEEGARSALEALLRLRPESVHYRSSAASALLKAGKADQALAVFGPDFIARHGDDHPVLYDYGSFWVNRNNNLESAVPALVKASKESPRAYADQYRAAEALTKAAKPETLLEVFGPNYLPYIKDNVLGLCMYAGFWLGRKENLESAVEALETASRLPKLNWFDRSYIARHFVQAGLQGRAEEIYGPAYLKGIAGDANAQENYASFWKYMKTNLSSALEAARAACEIAKDNSEAWATLAELLLVDGKPGEALTAIDKALSLTKSKDSLERYGGIKKQIKDALEKKRP